MNALRRLFRRRHEAEIVAFDVCMAETSSEREILQSLGVASLKKFEKMHRLDPNMPMDELEQIDAAIRQGNAEKGVEIEHLIVEDNSPYPEVSVNSVLKNIGLFDQVADECYFRFAQQSGITTSTYQRIQYVPGSSACS